MLSSDYVPASLLMAALRLPDAVPGIDLPAAVRTVTKTAGRSGRPRPTAARSRSASAPTSSASTVGTDARGAQRLARWSAGRVMARGIMAGEDSADRPGPARPRGRAERRRQGHADRRGPRRGSPATRLRVSPAPRDPAGIGRRGPRHDFGQRLRAGRRPGDFAFWWEAHGLKYALPAAIDDDIRAGRTVVCNVSRGIVTACASAMCGSSSCW